MIAYIVRRLLAAVPTIMGIVFLVFALFFIANSPEEMARRTLGMKADKVGRIIVRAIERNRRRVYLTTSGKLLIFLQRICPRFLDFVLYHGMVKRRLFT